jgi:hypothetical protein
MIDSTGDLPVPSKSTRLLGVTQSEHQDGVSETTLAPRLPTPGTPRRRSLRPSDLDSLPPGDRAAVDYLLALPVIDDD